MARMINHLAVFAVLFLLTACGGPSAVTLADEHLSINSEGAGVVRVELQEGEAPIVEGDGYTSTRIEAGATLEASGIPVLPVRYVVDTRVSPDGVYHRQCLESPPLIAVVRILWGVPDLCTEVQHTARE